MTVIWIRGDDRVAGLEGRLHADGDRFLADVEMAKAADQAHAVHLPGALFETPDQQHVPIKMQQFLRLDARLREFDLAGNRHPASPPPPLGAATPRPEDGRKPAAAQPRRVQTIWRKFGCPDVRTR